VSITPRPLGARRRRPRRMETIGRWLLRIAIAGAIFAVGVAVGQALEDRPEAGEPVTTFGTIRPWTRTTTTTGPTVTTAPPS
jgi:hypothetical protein